MVNSKTKNFTVNDIADMIVKESKRVDDRFERVDDRFDKFRKEINEDFKHHVGTIYEKFHGDIKLVIERQDGMDQRLERVENKIDLLTETVADIKVELTGDRMELDNKVDRSEHKGLERRVIALEVKA